MNFPTRLFHPVPTVRKAEYDRCTTHNEPIGEVTHINGIQVDERWLERPFIWHLDATGFPTVYCLPDPDFSKQESE